MARQDANETLLGTSFLYGGNAAYIEELYAAYTKDPNTVDPEWRSFFAGLKEDKAIVVKNAEGASWAKPNWPVAANGELVSALDGNWATLEKAVGEKIKARAEGKAPVAPADVQQATKDSVRAIMLIRAYRMRGHLHATLDPLGLQPRSDHEELHPQHYGFSEADWDRPIFLDNVLGLEFATIREIVAILKRTYCQTLGVEFMHISDPEEKAWIQERIEGKDKEISFTEQGRRAILNKLIEADGFEKFLDLKYTGTKRFGLDGSEAMVPALEQIIKRGGALGVKEIVIGMAHRGRLNVLANVMSKPFRAIFHEFKGGSSSPAEVEGSGDVKYHLGASSDRSFDGNDVHLSLTANPSHLEIVDPVVLGKVRAKQDQHNDAPDQRTTVLPLLIHGDAAFAGQGVVAECLGLSGLKGHRTGGSIHFIINNQIGFTTDPRFSRSSPYPSDVAKMVEAPIFHCNGDDPEAVVFAAKVATEYRQKFHKPVVIDMLCYRRFGHNEGDEPAFTQPKMYQIIRKHPSTLEIYGKRLIEAGAVKEAELEARKAEFRTTLDSEFDVANAYKANKADWLDGRWSGLKSVREDEDDPRRGRTGVPAATLREIARQITRVPQNFHLHRTIQRFLDNRARAIEAGEGIDWATAEALAFGSLLVENHRVRLSGQDVERGTFSQRHSVLIDQENEERYTPLNHIRGSQARYEVINSMLSEEAVLGFEYGYSLAEPNALVLWEAQFGDFANGAQVVIDQFISSGERKWLRMSGLVMLLPHGYEGQGPEHSSARLERYLQLCAEDNMQVANCTTPSNYFHILRRQLKRDFRKPLVLMTPKSLLRHKRAVSRLDDLTEGESFHRVLWDDAEKTADGIKLVKDDKIRRVVLCSGKVYYDLYEEREKRGINDVYLLRVEQLYPFPLKSLAGEVSRFRNAEVIWCQEEPKNMGAWTFVEPYLEWVLNQAGTPSKRPRYVGRPASASTAVGLMSKHLAQLQAFLNEALAV
ncbi:2-oxoglutarate dehydrogenase E1 component [Methylobacterium nodulans]|uniref:2-oxoglutarate dehydrogenase E1 component n=1 Tax=Methylobacterium nodulans (strain LMG 21967 / CNCM I-2342 / ORS 2060) TaxID=460265 RepID=B8IJB7_METNO|nr:2-oxoglutarate dehydrogenase E1 component [Methylobacterium nodulans]ACL56132.1 2-oxoglutarate dehydrogenase, E1 subunit [Methylobacterium nodulans ORS 2060]